MEVDGKQLAYGAPTNDSPASEAYAEKVDERVQRLRETNPDAEGAVPVDLVTGVPEAALDPQISVAGRRVAGSSHRRGARASPRTRSVPPSSATPPHKLLGLFGEDVVNVLEVNLDLDGEL